MSGSRSLNNSTSKRVLNLLEPVKLTVWKVTIERVTVVKFRVNYGGGNGAGCFEVKVWADTAKFTDVIVARHDDRGGPSRFLHTLTFLVRSVVSPLEAIENLRENAPTAGKCL